MGGGYEPLGFRKTGESTKGKESTTVGDSPEVEKEETGGEGEKESQ